MGSLGFPLLLLSCWMAGGVQTQQRGEGRRFEPEKPKKPAFHMVSINGKWSPNVPTKRGCYSWMAYECQKTHRTANAWQLVDGTQSRQACHARKQAFDAECKRGATQLLWVVGEVPAVPEEGGCHVWYPYGCPKQEASSGWKRVDQQGWSRPVDFTGTYRLQQASTVFHHANSSFEGCKQWKAQLDEECDAPVLAAWRTLHGVQFRDGCLDYDDEMGEEESWVALKKSAEKFPSIQGVAFRNSLNMRDMDKYSGVLWGQGVSGRITSDGAWVHVRDVGFLPLKLNNTLVMEREQVSCHDTRPGEDCYSEVMWARDTGLREHPGWYPGLTPTSSVRDFQIHLHSMGKGTCPRAC